MTNPCVICLGEVLFDCLADQAGRELAQVQSWTPYPGGAPANVACALVKLGTPAGFIGCVGQDKAGDSLVQLLAEIGVDTTGIQSHPTTPTRQVYVLRSETGDRLFAGFGERSPTEFADAYLEADRLPASLFEGAEFLVLGTLELAYPQTRQAIFKALELAEEYHLKILLDVNWRPMFWPDPSQARPRIEEIMQHVDFLKIAEEEALLLFNTRDATAIAHHLDSVEGVLVTAGEQGCTYYIGEHEGSVSAFSVPVQDTTGAGDSFVAGFVHQLCKYGIKSLTNPDTVKGIVTYASAVGAMTTMKPGAIAAQPTADEVDLFLSALPQP